MMQLIEQVVALVQKAGEATIPFWQSQLTVDRKADNSPITEADLTANRILIADLSSLTPDIPIISEEACDIDLTTRQQWQKWWLIDPLDGTKEFIDGRKDFTVNVALIENGKVIFGVVGIPVTNTCYFGGKQLGAWKQNKLNKKTAIHCKKANSDQLSLVASHRHTSEKQQQLLNQLQQITTVSLKNIGSSLKFCLLAEGNADCYPRFAPTCQWDTAAAQGVLEGAGGVVLTETEQLLDYHPAASYLNPFFIALADADYWQPVIFKLIKNS